MKIFYSLSLAAILVIQACKPEYPATTTNTEKVLPIVEVEELRPQTNPIPLNTSGIIEAKRQSNLSFKIGGIIQQIYVEEGQDVEKNQLLAILDQTEIRAQVTKAEQAVQKAERDFERIQNLFNQKAATEEQLQNTETAKRIAASDLEIARFNLAYSEIRATEKGRILRRLSEKGELTQAGGPVFVFASSGRSTSVLRIGIADKDIVKLAVGDSAHLTIDAYPNQTFKAYVSEIAGAADPQVGTFEVELRPATTLNKVRSGFFSEVKLFPSLQEAYYIIPMAAIFKASPKSMSVFVLDDTNKTVEKAIPYLDIRPEGVVVDARVLQEGSRVVTSGMGNLFEGDTVGIWNKESI